MINYNFLQWMFFFLFGIAFIIFANLQAHQIYKLSKIVHNKSPKFYEIINLWKYGIPGFLIPRPITIIKYVWSNKNINNKNKQIIYKVRLYQKLTLLFFILALASPLIVEIVNSVKGFLGGYLDEKK